ncbi:DoxX family protein [Aestuariivirga litoralis]|uniref:DoxX family protein n=1 Tax=Aestuariivirga litoralis TaxID=2650924 RepID=UPI0018C618AE|nr:DoxX family protein [Aestuariivirga litoralis]MBG1233091.1 DoxX family protein [Aestuariivirga litoralis]
MDKTIQNQGWKTAALLVGRLVMAAMFAMAFTFKFIDINMTATYIASAGFPMSVPLAWIAAIFELALFISFLTGAYFREACILAAIYVVFLAFSFHGMSTWSKDAEGLNFGAFVSHFPFAAGLLFGAVSGPGRVLTWNRTCLK